MSFNAVEYLGRVDPSQRYSISQLTGGLINVTLRAKKIDASGDSIYPNEASLILKHAPPYFAARGEGVPLTTYRQQVEARALTLFLPNEAHSLHRVCQRSSVAVPKLLNHDSNDNVLIISDLGSLPNVAEIFASLGGYGERVDKPNYAFGSDLHRKIGTAEQVTSFYREIGRRFGTFFALLHSPRSLETFLSGSNRGKDFLENPHLDGFAFKHGVAPIQDHLKLFSQILHPEEAEELFRRAAEDVLNPVKEYELSVTIADCWTGSLLISEPSSSGCSTCAVVDWEFAKLGRGLNNDIAQLLARFALMQTAADFRHDADLSRYISAFVQAFSLAYKESSTQERAPWTTNVTEESVGLCLGNIKPGSPRAQMLRSAFLTHGMEIMRCGMGKVWRCNDASCLEGDQHKTEKEKCPLIQAMVSRAVWYFRHAQKDEQAFCSAQNLQDLNEAAREGRYLMALF